MYISIAKLEMKNTQTETRERERKKRFNAEYFPMDFTEDDRKLGNQAGFFFLYEESRIRDPE